MCLFIFCMDVRERERERESLRCTCRAFCSFELGNEVSKGEMMWDFFLNVQRVRG